MPLLTLLLGLAACAQEGTAPPAASTDLCLSQERVVRTKLWASMQVYNLGTQQLSVTKHSNLTEREVLLCECSVWMQFVSNLLQDFGVRGVAPFPILMQCQGQLGPCHASQEVHKGDSKNGCQQILWPPARYNTTC